MTERDAGLVFEDRLPVAVQVLDGLPDDYRLALVNESNEALLRAIMALQESADLEEHDEVRMELRRQDLKLRLLMELVSDLILQHKSMPAPLLLSLTPDTLEWRPARPPRVGERVAIELYINPLLPKPVILHGAVEAAEEGAATRVRFAGMGRNVRDLLEKLLFRHHRRAVAQGRQQQ